MRTKIPKQLLWILDYEDYLDRGIAMTGEGRAWVKLHKRQLDTPQKRVRMMHNYAPGAIGKEKKKQHRRYLPSEEKRLLNNKFEVEWQAANSLQADFDNKRKLIELYKRKGVTWATVYEVTGHSRSTWVCWGVNV